MKTESLIALGILFCVLCGCLSHGLLESFRGRGGRRGGDNLIFGVHGIIGQDGLNFGLYLVIVNVGAHLMAVRYREQVLMIAFGLQIVIVVAMFTIEHKKKHYELKKRH